MIIQTNKISTYEHFQSVLAANGHSEVVSVKKADVIAIELVNYGAAVAWFTTNASNGTNAAATDRVLLVGERLLLPVSCNEIKLFSTTGTSVEVNFLR